MVALAEFAVVFIEIDLLAWVPLFFFAATLIFIGFDLILEWLVSCFKHSLVCVLYCVDGFFFKFLFICLTYDRIFFQIYIRIDGYINEIVVS